MLVLYAEFNLNQAWQMEKFCQSWYLHSWMENVYVFMGKCDSQQSIKIADIFLNPPFTATGVNQSFVIENATTTNSKVENSKWHKKNNISINDAHHMKCDDLTCPYICCSSWEKTSTDGANGNLGTQVPSFFGENSICWKNNEVLWIRKLWTSQKTRRKKLERIPHVD